MENCTFIGTDKGLRFKSVRGRGGVVERIYARNIYMKDIAGEAIFFDMYYFVKFATDGERDMRPEVNEGTPVFRDMVFEHIVCQGAKKGIFIRGLPEMPISNISIRNSVLSTESGAELIDAEGIRIESTQLNTSGPSPIVTIDNSRSVTIDGLSYPGDHPTVLQAKGARTKDIFIRNSGIRKGSQKVLTDGDVAKNAVSIQ